MVPQTDVSSIASDAASCVQCETYLSGWKRAQADYQNLKRQSDQERTEFAKYANERLLGELLPAIDQFGLALAYIPSTESLPEEQRKVWENWLNGVRAVGTLWNGMTDSIGLERIPTDGLFNPTLHDAAGEEVAEGKESGMIQKVLQEGWLLHGKVLRPARVILVK